MGMVTLTPVMMMMMIIDQIFSPHQMSLRLKRTPATNKTPLGVLQVPKD